MCPTLDNQNQVGPAPPNSLDIARTTSDYMQRDANLHLDSCRSNHKHQHHNHHHHDHHHRESSQTTEFDPVADWLEEDPYKDFETIYNSMSKQHQPVQSNSESSKRRQQFAGQVGGWSQSATFETGLLAKSLADVEEALRRANGCPQTNWSPTYLCPTEAGSSTNSSRNLQIPTANLQRQTSSPMWSTGASEQTRADSRNTNQSYQNGPALVEEMTLSDLEDEISSSLMAGGCKQNNYYSQVGEQLFKARRSRQPVPASLFLRHTNATHIQQQLPEPELINSLRPTTTNNQLAFQPMATVSGRHQSEGMYRPI